MKDKAPPPLSSPNHQKNKIKFAMTEKSVARSNQLTMSEKAFYTTLRSYFYTSSPCGCHPSLTTLAKDCNLSRRWIRKLKNSLVDKGLIICGLGGGRKNTNNYQFPLVTGSDEEKKQLLTFLELEKRGNSTSPFNNNKGQTPLSLLQSKGGTPLPLLTSKRGNSTSPEEDTIKKDTIKKRKKEKDHLKDDQKRKEESLTLNEKKRKQIDDMMRAEQKDLDGQTKMFEKEKVKGVVKGKTRKKPNYMIRPQEISGLIPCYKSKT